MSGSTFRLSPNQLSSISDGGSALSDGTAWPSWGGGGGGQAQVPLRLNSSARPDWLTHSARSSAGSRDSQQLEPNGALDGVKMELRAEPQTELERSLR